MAFGARPLSDLPKFLEAVSEQSKSAAADASNAAALYLTRGLRQELPTRRLNSRAIWGGKRSGLGVNFGYGEADASKARFKPTAFVGGRGPVHILENSLRPHTMTRNVTRRPGGGRRKPPTIRDITAGRVTGLGRRRGTEGPTLRQAGITKGTITTHHPGVSRNVGPMVRGLYRNGNQTMGKWTTTFKRKAREVKWQGSGTA